ncbi:hypothetical protein CDPAHKCJ_00663 [Cobetia sp. MB87]|nr:hypothetical protein [Cobetia sp. MB87]
MPLPLVKVAALNSRPAHKPMKTRVFLSIGIKFAVVLAGWVNDDPESQVSQRITLMSDMQQPTVRQTCRSAG